MWVVFEADIHRGASRRYFVGLEAVGGWDSFGFCIIEQRLRPKAFASVRPAGPAVGEPEPATYIVRHLERLRLGRRDPVSVVSDVCEPSALVPPWVVQKGQGDARGNERCDRVVEVLKERGLRPLTVTLLTSNQARGSATGTISLRQTDVVAAMTALFKTGELKLASLVALVPAFLAQLQQFHTCDSAATNDPDVPRRLGPNDLVLCAALPVWYGIQQAMRG